MSAYGRKSLPHSTREAAVFLHQRFGVAYESHSELVALLHQLGFDYKKPQTFGRGLDVDKQRALIEGYEKLLNALDRDEVALFADGVHLTYQLRAVGCWAPVGDTPALAQTTGRKCLNILGARDLETGKTAIVEVEGVNDASVRRLLEAVEAKSPQASVAHLFLDNAPAHHAVFVPQ